MSMKNSDDTIGNRSRDLPVCSTISTNTKFQQNLSSASGLLRPCSRLDSTQLYWQLLCAIAWLLICFRGRTDRQIERQTPAKCPQSWQCSCSPSANGPERLTVQTTCHVSHQWRLSFRATQYSHGPLDRCLPDGSERHMSLPASYTPENIAKHFLPLCPSFLLGYSSALSFRTLPISVPFRFSFVFFYFLLLCSISYYLSAAVCLSVPNPPLLHSFITFFFLPYLFLLHLRTLLYRPTLFCLHATYCSVSFVCLFVYSLFVNSSIGNNLFGNSLFVNILFSTIYLITV
jgi:hypothetical protein